MIGDLTLKDVLNLNSGRKAKTSEHEERKLELAGGQARPSPKILAVGGMWWKACVVNRLVAAGLKNNLPFQRLV